MQDDLPDLHNVMSYSLDSTWTRKPVEHMFVAPIPLEAVKRERILVVDDSPTVTRMFTKYLSPRYECCEAMSYNDALDQLRSSEFSVVITDVIMPGLSGIELLRKVISEFPDTPVIVVTGVARPQRALDAVRQGAFDYLIKPCDPEIVALTVERALERRKLQTDARSYKSELENRNIELVRRRYQLENLQTQIVQNEKMASLGQLASGVAHELNNPIGFVSANLEMIDVLFADLRTLIDYFDNRPRTESEEAECRSIKQRADFPNILSEIKSILTDCREGSERIRDIVLNLRTFSRLDEAEFKDTNIHEGIDATLRLLSSVFSSGEIVLRKDFGDVPLIGGFAGQLNQVWMNLLLNAVHSIKGKTGEVAIKTRSDDEKVYVRFSDTGCGIPRQNLSKIFEPFFTTKPVGEGTGLGLAISFGIVQRHGGNIKVESVLKKGTTFTVELPRQFDLTAEPSEKAIVVFPQIN